MASKLLTLHNTIARTTVHPELSSQPGFGFSGLLLLAGVKQMQAKQALCRLKAGKVDSSLNPSKLRKLSLCLYEQLLEFYPALSAAVLPPPALPDAAIEQIWLDFQNPDLDSQWQENHTLGYTYQFYCRPARQLAKGRVQSSNKTLNVAELIAFTQLYTPDWVVDFLLQNTVLNQCTASELLSRRHRRFRLKEGTTPGYRVKDLKILDPACGSGHFLLNAFDLLFELYKLEGYNADEAVNSILSQNLFGVDIDPLALAVAALAVFIKSCSLTPALDIRLTNLMLPPATCSVTGNSLLGSLIRPDESSPDHLLKHKYHAVVANPPYVGRKLLDRPLKSALKALYPDAHNDLCAAFVQRGLELLQPNGRLGIITQAPLMFLPSYGNLRRQLVEKEKLIAAVDVGPGVFPLQGGEKIDSALLIIESTKQQPQDSHEAAFLNIQKTEDPAATLEQMLQANCSRAYASINPRIFQRHRQYAFNYDCPEVMLNVIEQAHTLSSLADLRQGLATTDNKRFLRFWWDVSPEQIGSRWFPYIKGAGSQKWHSSILQLINWENDGAEIKQAVSFAYPYLKGKTEWVVKNESFYFKEGLTFSFVSSKSLSVRKMPSGCIFDVGGSAVFAQPEKLDFLLAYLNSSFISATASLFNPTLNFQVGDLKQLPVFNFSPEIEIQLSELSRQCQQLKSDLASWEEPSWGGVNPTTYEPHASIETACRQHLQKLVQLNAMQDSINELVINAVARGANLSKAESNQLQNWLETHTPEHNTTTKISTKDNFIHLMFHHQLELLLSKQPILLLQEEDLKEQLCTLGMPHQVITSIESHCRTSVEHYLLKTFMPEHARRFHKSPLYHLATLPQHKCRLFFSSQALRAGTISGDTNLPKTNQLKHDALAAARAALNNLRASMQTVPDWTGRELSEVVKKFTS